MSTGTWTSLYDDQTWHDPADLQIDHVVPLREAWRSGAAGWDRDKREAFANDLDPNAPELLAVTASVNESKGDRDPSEWLPPKNQCPYVIDWIMVKDKWGLSVDPAEKTALDGVLRSCP